MGLKSLQTLIGVLGLKRFHLLARHHSRYVNHLLVENPVGVLRTLLVGWEPCWGVENTVRVWGTLFGWWEHCCGVENPVAMLRILFGGVINFLWIGGIESQLTKYKFNLSFFIGFPLGTLMVSNGFYSSNFPWYYAISCANKYSSFIGCHLERCRWWCPLTSLFLTGSITYFFSWCFTNSSIIFFLFLWNFSLQHCHTVLQTRPFP